MIAGRLGGRTLVAPRGRATRPTSDRVREAVFAILGDVGGVRVLDLYAGSGALGIEALSRGAAEATLVDSSAAAVGTIRRNLQDLGLEAEVRREKARTFLGRAQKDGRQYDLVFVDPPYHLGESLTTAVASVLAKGARVIVESDRRAPLEFDLPLIDQRRYGDTLIFLYGTG